MKKVIYAIILISSISSCIQDRNSIQQQIFDEYLLIHFDAWSTGMGKNYIPYFHHKAGDTIRLMSQLEMLIIPNDTIIEIPIQPQSFLSLDSGTLISIVSEGGKNTFEMQLGMNDTVYNGVVLIDDYLNSQWGKDYLNEKRSSLIKQFSLLKEEGLSKLSKKYKLNRDSVLTLISHEYFQRTGKRGINY